MDTSRISSITYGLYQMMDIYLLVVMIENLYGQMCSWKLQEAFLREIGNRKDYETEVR